MINKNDNEMLSDSFVPPKSQRPPKTTEFTFTELILSIWEGKIFIIFVCTIFAVGSVAIALSMPNIYKASALMAPVSSEGGAGGLAGLASKFGGLAGIAGINIGGGDTTDKTSLALEIIKTRAFIESFIERHQLTVPIMATKKWDYALNQLIYDEDVYDNRQNKWIRQVELPKKAKPSPWETYTEFTKLLSVSQSKLTSMITIEIEYYSPHMAKQWLSWLISDINNFMREQDKVEAQNSINYLTKKLDNIKNSNMENIFYQLIEEQTKNMMLIEVKPEYVLKTIQPPQVPDEKAKPARALIVILGTLLGGILSLLIVLFRFFSKKADNEKSIKDQNSENQ